MFSWKVWMTFVIVCISCESRHLNSYISLTAMQPGLLVAGWSRSWSHGFNPDIKDLFLFRALLFTSRSCKGFLFPLLANAWLFGSLTLSGFDYLHLLNARFRDSLVFSIFSDILLTEVCFAYFSTHYSFSFLSCLPSYQRSLSVLWFTYFPFLHHCL